MLSELKLLLIRQDCDLPDRFHLLTHHFQHVLIDDICPIIILLFQIILTARSRIHSIEHISIGVIKRQEGIFVKRKICLDNIVCKYFFLIIPKFAEHTSHPGI